MKTALILAVLFCAALAAPTEDKELKAVEAVVEAPVEELVAAAEVAAEAPEEEVVVTEEDRLYSCPDGWSYHRSRCFRFVNSPMSWFRAEEHCNHLGAHLASATSASEYNFLQQLTLTAGQSFAWMGGFYLEDHWLWIDRQGFYFLNWYSPNTASSSPCIYLRTTTGWRNLPCRTSYPFICSKNQYAC